MPFFLRLSKASRRGGFVAVAGAVGFALGIVAFVLFGSHWLVQALSDAPGPVVGVVMGVILALAVSTLTSFVVIARVRANYRQIRSALNNMTQGLCMFDGAARLILCNERYIEMYHLRPEHAQRCTPLRDLLIERTAAGTFRATRTLMSPSASDRSPRGAPKQRQSRSRTAASSRWSVARSGAAAGWRPTRT